MSPFAFDHLLFVLWVVCISLAVWLPERERFDRLRGVFHGAQLALAFVRILLCFVKAA